MKTKYYLKRTSHRCIQINECLLFSFKFIFITAFNELSLYLMCVGTVTVSFVEAISKCRHVYLVLFHILQYHQRLCFCSDTATLCN